MHVTEESHSGIVPRNHSNKDENGSAESGEGRPLIKENERGARVTGAGGRAESSREQ